MAKPLGPKTRLIREAIQANPTVQNKALAELINASDARQSDRIKVTPFQVAEQRQKLKKLEKAAATPLAAPVAPEPAKKKRGRPKGSGKPKATAQDERVTAPAPKRAGNPVELIDRLFDFAEECGGMGQLKRLVDRLA